MNAKRNGKCSSRQRETAALAVEGRNVTFG